MTPALTKVDTPLMERYTTTCQNCAFIRQFFGTADEARQSALTMGWEFRRTFPHPMNHEFALCPHCKMFVKEPS